MWILYYLNEKRVDNISYQVKSGILKEERKTNKKQFGIRGKGTFGLNKMIAKIFKVEGEVDANADSTSDNEQLYEYHELDQKTKNALDYFSKKKNYQLIDENSIKQKIQPNKLIRFSGMFHPHIKGDSYSERLSNYEGAKNICWSGKCGDIQLKFYTGKSSLISNTPIHPAIETVQGKIFIEGFGLFSKQNGNKLTIVPILFGTQIEK